MTDTSSIYCMHDGRGHTHLHALLCLGPYGDIPGRLSIIRAVPIFEVQEERHKEDKNCGVQETNA